MTPATLPGHLKAISRNKSFATRLNKQAARLCVAIMPSGRFQQAIPMRCDMTDCAFHTQPLIWLGKRLPLILDHINGNNLDNSPQNLRYVCPNCDSQLSTRGGGNRGRVQEAGDGRYVLMSRDGKRHYYLIPETGCCHLSGHPPSVIVAISGSDK